VVEPVGGGANADVVAATQKAVGQAVQAIADAYAQQQGRVGLLRLSWYALCSTPFSPRSSAMRWVVMELKQCGEYALQVRFRDGVEGPVRFLPSFFRGVFADLQDPGNSARCGWSMACDLAW
jgi:hypothetical protein